MHVLAGWSEAGKEQLIEMLHDQIIQNWLWWFQVLLLIFGSNETDGPNAPG